jgi:hypothetical protein
MELKAIPRYLRFCAVACLAVLGLAASEHHGLVKFGTVPVPGATVTATLDDKKVVAVTDESGAYSFPELADGVWKIQVDMLCFSTVTKDIGIAPNAPGAEWELKLMSMDEIKPSMQAAPAAGAPPTGTAAPGTAAPAPGATGQPAATQAVAAPPAKGKKGAAAPAVPQQGFQRTDVNASADGAAMSNAPPSIAAAEATQTASDAFVVNGSSSNGIERRAIGNGRKGPRSLYNGGIDFRGFENDLLDARNFSTTGEDVARTPFTKFTIGGGVQGPLLIPHLFRWQGNFSATFGMTQNRTAQDNPTVMPTPAERTGDFSQVTTPGGSPITLMDPTTGQPFPNGIIPVSRISPQANYLLNYYPLPQFTAAPGAYNYDAATVGRSRAYQLNTRVNKPLDNRGKNRLNGSFTYTKSSGDTPNIFSFLDTNRTSNYGANLQYYHNFTRTLWATFTVNYSRSSTLATPFFANKTNVSGQAGITGNDQTAVDWGPPSLGFSGGSGIAALSDGTPSFNRNQTTAFSGSVTYIHRPHTFTFGADYRIQDFSIFAQSNPRGSFGFNGLTTGFDFASFLLGIPDTSAIAFGNADKYLKAGMYDLFVNDNWIVSPSLTVQWGLRWDYGSPITEEYGRLVNLDIAPGFTNSAPVIGSDATGSLTHNQYPSSLINPDKHEVSPRVSFAWKPIFGASTLLRGGYGVYYNTSAYMSMAQKMDQQSPLSKSLNVSNSSIDPLTLANGFVASPNVTTDNFAVDPNFRVGYSQNWYVSVQQNVSAANLVTVQYSGVKGTRAAQEFQPNTYPVGAVNPCPSCLPGYTYLTSNGNSTREAGSVTFRRRFHGGLQSTFTYTYSKSIDDSGGLGTSSAPIAQNWLNLAGERGLSSFDQRHLFNAQFQYTTGVGVRGGGLLSGWRGLIIKGWTFTSNITAGSGLPFSPTYFLPSPVTGTSGTLRPEYVGGDVYGGAAGRYLNAAAFAAPPLGQWGDAGRDSITGPNQFSMNASMARSFADNITVTFNSNNVLNHPTFPGWNNQFNPTLSNGGQFGILNSPAAGSMRTVVATLRWTF